jgi:nickel-dependent lactate racemase
VRLELPYGEGHQAMEIDDDKLVAVVKPREVPRPDSMRVLHAALQVPLGAPHVSEFLRPGARVLVVVNDGTRPTPTRRVLESVWSSLKGCDARFIVACGTHRAPTEDELQRIFGPLLPEVRGRLEFHDAKASNMVKVGESSRGNEFLVNRRLDEAERVLVVGSVEPHYFAGFTGGRKAFLPGLSAYDTVERNHRNALSPESRILRLEGNPVHDEMAELQRCLQERKPDSIYSIQTISLDGLVPFAAAGDIEAAFRAMVTKAVELFCVEVPRRAEIVVTVATKPGDATLYQAQKALENAKPALAPGGTAILVSECIEGIGPGDFYDLLSSAPTPDGVLGRLASGYKLGWHKAAKLAEMSLGGGKVRAVTSMPSEVLAKAFICGHASLAEALAAARNDLGDPSIIVMPEGSSTVPMVRGGGKGCAQA